MSNDGPPIAIAHVIDTLERGGAEKILLAIANGLPPSRFRVHIVCTRMPGSLADSRAAHVQLHSLDRSSRADLAALRRFDRLMRSHDVRLVHTHSHTSAYLARLSRLTGHARWLHVMHDHHGPVEESIALRLADRLLLRNVDYYIAVSDRLESYASRWIGIPDQRRELLINGVQVPVLRSRRGEGRFTIAQVARITPEKNQKLALAAAYRLRDVVPGHRWLLAGRTGSPYADSCLLLSKELGLEHNVEFLGELDSVNDTLALADVGVLTSDIEGLPVALLEYMAAGLPVVVTDVGECSAVVRASRGGTVVPPGDPAALAQALARYAADPDEAKRAGAAGRRYVMEHHSVAAMVDRISAVYSALLGASDNMTSYSRRGAGSV